MGERRNEKTFAEKVWSFSLDLMVEAFLDNPGAFIREVALFLLKVFLALFVTAIIVIVVTIWALISG